MVHQYKLMGYNIVLDTCSGAVHSVDPVAYDMIEMYPDCGEAEIVAAVLKKYAGQLEEAEVRECYADIAALAASGQLFTPDAYESLALDLISRKTTLKALCLHVAHTCNLNCEYCFAAGGKYQGERALMSLEVGCRAIDFLIENSRGRHNLEVDFFGGEPLMNWGIVKQIVGYAREREKIHNKNFRFTLTTNGLLIDDDVIEFSNREMSNVVLSLDGRRHVHDRLRKNCAGGGSYDLIVPKFKKFVASRGGKNYFLRGTFTRHNTDFTNDILHMADLGFTELSMEPVVCAQSDSYALREEDLPLLFEQYERLAAEMINRRREGRGFNFYHYILDLTHGPCVYKRVSGCGSGSEYMAVTPWGELFPCHQFVGDQKYSLGNIWDGVTNTQLRDKFKCCNAYSRPECADCWAKLYCSGGCAANSYHATGDIRGVYRYGCELFKKRIECAVMIKVAESEEGD